MSTERRVGVWQVCADLGQADADDPGHVKGLLNDVGCVPVSRISTHSEASSLWPMAPDTCAKR